MTAIPQTENCRPKQEGLGPKAAFLPVRLAASTILSPSRFASLFKGGMKMLKRYFLSVCLFALIGLAISPAIFAQSQSGESIIPEGTEIQLALLDPVSSKLSEAGDEIRAVVRRDVFVDGR